MHPRKATALAELFHSFEASGVRRAAVPARGRLLSGLAAFLAVVVIIATASAAEMLPGTDAVDSVTATGPAIGSTLEDRVEVLWSTDESVAVTSTFRVHRDGMLIHVAASTETLFEDFSAVPNDVYTYCVDILASDGTITDVGCDEGSRVIARPTGFRATDGAYEGHVRLTWSDRSEIEAGFNLYRDAGNALELDGIDDYTQAREIVDLTGSFTFEFWARRASTGTDDFVINLETNPNGDPVDVDLEIGFLADDRFAVAFGTEILASEEAYTDSEWRHWAVAYDAPDRRRLVYLDGNLLVTDVMPYHNEPTGDLEFGRRSRQSPQSSRGHFDGAIDEIRLWDHALTRAEVRDRRMALLTGAEQGLMAYWSMDAHDGLEAPDFFGMLSADLIDVDVPQWVPTGVPQFRREIGADLTAAIDETAVSGYRSYTYQISAFEDIDADGHYTAGTDFESERRTDDGWRGYLTPPGEVAATDGQFNDRIRITWNDYSQAEEGYRVYRSGELIATLEAGSTAHDDMDAEIEIEIEYCVAAFSGGTESVRTCDLGMAGGLPAPVDVAATYGEFDDRVLVSWTDISDTEEGFEVFRDGVLLATVGADGEEYNDLAAVQGVEYEYCVRAYSRANPLDPAWSVRECAPSPGMRAVILDPTDLMASVDDFEDRVEMSWQNPSTTVMVFMVYRDGGLIQVLDFNTRSTTDTGILSDVDIDYCVTGATVPDIVDPRVVQGEIAQVLENIALEDAISEQVGGSVSTVTTRLDAVKAIMETSVAGKGGSSGLVESGPSCDTGRRLLIAPTALEASDNDFESHVELNWEDNSQAESGYLVSRAPVGGPPVILDTLSANRTMYEDYTGTPGVEFEYIVEAYDEYDRSHEDRDPGMRTLEPPTQFRASDAASETDVRLRWRDNSAAEKGYRIYRKAAGDMGFSVVGETGKNEPAFTDQPLDELLGQVLEYQVAAFDDYGESVRVTDDGSTFIEAPTSVNASDAYSSKPIVVVWVDQSNVEHGYRLTRRTVGNPALDHTYDLASGVTKFHDNDVQAGVEYVYCVEATLAAGANLIFSEPTCDTGSLWRDTSGGGGSGDPTFGPVRIGDDEAYPSSVDRAVRFGHSVALRAGKALVGVPGADGSGGTGGVATYAYDLDNVWTYERTLYPAAGEEFGFAVDLGAGYGLVGDPFDNGDGQGAYWAYTMGNPPVVAISRAPGANAGVAVATVDSFLVVGDNQSNFGPSTGHGAVTVCNVQADVFCASPARLELVIPDSIRVTADFVSFGQSVAVTRHRTDTGDSLYALVGAPGPGGELAYVFECSLGSPGHCGQQDDWLFAREVDTPFRPRGSTDFGTSVALDSTLAVVGAPGSAAILVMERTAPLQWDQKKLSDPIENAAAFGAAVAVRDRMIVVGAPAEKISTVNGAGATYAFNWNGTDLGEPFRYDARVAGGPLNAARFGSSLDLDADFILIGAPRDGDMGAAYSVPIGHVQPDEPPTPPEVTLVAPTGVTASDGSAPDRIQIRWTDEADEEDGHLIYRSIPGGETERLAEVSTNIEFYDDFAAAPGEAYTYCVAAFSYASGELEETEAVCDIGWRPPNGAISGVVMTGGSAGTADVEICLDPSPNRALLFDGIAGHVEAPSNEALALAADFTVEAWIRAHATTGERYIVSRDSAFAVSLVNGGLRFTAVEVSGIKTFDADTTLTAGSWYHVAVTRDKLNDVSFYLNGRHVTTIQSGDLITTAGRDTLAIGQKGDGTGFFHGEIDAVRIWNTTRSPADIQNGQLRAMSGKEENLVGSWPLDQGTRLIVPDISESANHGHLHGGAYLADHGAPLETCAVTGEDGNFSIQRIRYGESTEFQATASLETREYEPAFHLITLTTESPVQNQVYYTDVTSYTIAGIVQYEDFVDGKLLTCPVPTVGIHVDKSNVAIDNNLKTTTRADGSFAVGVDPSADVTDPWYVLPRVADQDSVSTRHTFDPSSVELVVAGDIFDLTFNDQLRHTLSGHFSGGDPETCAKDIGVARIRIFTMDGCYDRVITVDSRVDGGYFEVDLPPLEYLVQVVDVTDSPPARADEIEDFFEALGAIEVDLTQGDTERNLTYRAPLVLSIEGFETPMCGGAITQTDEDGNVLRLLPEVPVLEEYEFVELSLNVREDYGGDAFCEVNEGTVTVYDAISDRVDADSTIALENGTATYTVFGASPNIYSGARIGGVDRSFQKPITVVAQVEGRPSIMETEWAIVEGYRERSSTFVSATTEEFPLMMLHDPPGSNSYAFIEKGATYCNSISNTFAIGGARGIDFEGQFGFKTEFVTAPVGAGVTIQTGGGFKGGFKIMVGAEYSGLVPLLPNRQICVGTTETLTTSSDPTWVGEDIHVGVALNLIFAIADVLEAGEDQCSLDLSETLAADLDQADPFETTYAYGESHIRYSLIPELENLLRLAGGDATITGEIGQDETVIRLNDALSNWRKQLSNSEQLQEDALAEPEINRSFSGGTEFSFVESVDTTRVRYSHNVRIYIDAEAHAGGVFDIGKMETHLYGRIEGHAEWNTSFEGTGQTTQNVGYVLSDGDTGDYFSVDIAKNPRYGTYVFGTRSGRSSNPWEANTQKRDNPIILVDPPVLHNVDPDDAGRFQLTLINGSESMERRSYTIDVPGEINPGNLGITVTGDLLGGERLETFLLDPGKALTINMDVFASPSAFSYRRTGVMMYPMPEMQIWLADTRQPFVLSDTAFFSVFFDSTGGNVLASVMQEGWNWISTNRPEGDIGLVLEDYSAVQGDLIRTERAEAVYDTLAGWRGSLTKLVPGVGYQARVHKPGLLRLKGEPVDVAEPIPLRQGWTWVGYLPAKRMPVNDALASLEGRAIEGDMILGQHAFAQYVPGTGWVGALEELEPGEGYALSLAAGGSLVYPPAPETIEPRPPTVRETTVAGPEWSVVPEEYDAAMTLVAEIADDSVPVTHTALRVAVTANGEVRGVGDVRYVDALDRYLSFVVVYGLPDENMDMTVHVFDGNSDALYEDVGTLTFSPMTAVGQPNSPARLELSNAGAAPNLLDLPKEFALYPNYPNPFNPVTVIAYDMPEAGRVTLTVYDVLGRRVAHLVDAEQPAGRHRVVFDAHRYASGLYLYRMEVGDFAKVGKMMLVK